MGISSVLSAACSPLVRAIPAPALVAVEKIPFSRALCTRMWQSSPLSVRSVPADQRRIAQKFRDFVVVKRLTEIPQGAVSCVSVQCQGVTETIRVGPEAIVPPPNSLDFDRFSGGCFSPLDMEAPFGGEALLSPVLI